MPRIAINGFGRIGRAVFRAGIDDPEIKFAAINDLQKPEELAYLLKHDSIYGGIDAEVKVKDGNLQVNQKQIKFLREKDPANLPWNELEVDVAAECTGFFTKKEDAAKHLDAGARKVLISAPAKGDVLTIVYGVNHEKYDPSKHDIVSNASCTTNSFAPMVKVLNEEFGIMNGLMTTVHAYTGTQNLIDGPSRKPRRRRAAAVNIIPTTTGAAKAVGKVFPELEGKLDAIAMRVPIPCGSVTDFVARLKQKPSRDEVNEAFRSAADDDLKGVMEYSEEDLVSSDILKNPHTVIIDSKKTMAQGNLVKTLGWYDNEWAFACKMLDVMKLL